LPQLVVEALEFEFYLLADGDFVSHKENAIALHGQAFHVAHLQTELQVAQTTDVMLTAVDEDFAEVSLHGRWIAESPLAHEGVFIVALPNRLEYFVYTLWQATQSQAISLY